MGQNSSWDVSKPAGQLQETSDPVIADKGFANKYLIVFCEYLFHLLKSKTIDNFFEMCFSELFCCYSVSHCSNKPTIKIIDW